MVKHEILETLIDLSNIFTEGFTIALNQVEDSFKQYNNTNKPFIVSYKTIITVDKNVYPYKTVYYKIDSLKLNKCIIGGWLDSGTNIYYIELNKTFKSMVTALKFAYKHKQLYIYNINNQTSIKVKGWEQKIKKWLHE